jgi:hypothetical protein
MHICACPCPNCALSMSRCAGQRDIHPAPQHARRHGADRAVCPARLQRHKQLPAGSALPGRLCVPHRRWHWRCPPLVLIAHRPVAAMACRDMPWKASHAFSMPEAVWWPEAAQHMRRRPAFSWLCRVLPCWYVVCFAGKDIHPTAACLESSGMRSSGYLVANGQPTFPSAQCGETHLSFA